MSIAATRRFVIKDDESGRELFDLTAVKVVPMISWNWTFKQKEHTFDGLSREQMVAALQDAIGFLSRPGQEIDAEIQELNKRDYYRGEE